MRRTTLRRIALQTAIALGLTASSPVTAAGATPGTPGKQSRADFPAGPAPESRTAGVLVRRLVTFLIAVVTTFIVVGSGTAYARPFGIRSFACESGGLRIFCTVETTSTARAPLQIRWVVDGVARPIANDSKMLSICCREGRSTPVQVTVIDADGDSAFASQSVLCRKIQQ